LVEVLCGNTTLFGSKIRMTANIFKATGLIAAGRARTQWISAGGMAQSCLIKLYLAQQTRMPSAALR
jgi:hypothetical protein